MAVVSTFTDSSVDASNATVYTFSSQAIGTASADRYVVVGVSGRGGANLTVSTVTIGGTSATQLVTVAAFENTSELWWANVPNGTTADIVVTWNTSGRARCGIGVWALTGVSGTATDTDSAIDDSGTDAVTITLTVNAGGAAIAYNIAGGITTPTWTWTGVTEDFDGVMEGQTSHTGANDEFASAQSPLTITLTPSSSDQKCIVGASFAETAAVGTNMQINITDAWKSVDAMQINIGDAWKTVDGAQVNIGDSWKTIF